MPSILTYRVVDLLTTGKGEVQRLDQSERHVQGRRESSILQASSRTDFEVQLRYSLIPNVIRPTHKRAYAVWRFLRENDNRSIGRRAASIAGFLNLLTLIPKSY